MDVGAGVGDDGAGGQGGHDAGLQLAGLLVGHGGGAADEALAALGEVGAQDEVQLAAGAGDLAVTGGFGVDLAVEVQVHAVVDGNVVVQGGNGADVVGVVHRHGHALGVVVQEVVHLLGAGAESEGLAVLVDVLAFAGDDAGLGDVHESVHEHFRVHADVLQVGLGDEGAHGVGHAADAQLQAGAVGDLFHDHAGHDLVHLGGRDGGHDAQGRVFAFDYVIDFGDVHRFFEAAQAAGHVFVDFNDDLLGPLAHGGHMGGAGAEVEVAVLIHGSYLENGHVQVDGVFAVETGQLGITQGAIESKALFDSLTLDAGHVPGIPDEMVLGVLDFEDLRFHDQDAAVDDQIVQVGHALGQDFVHGPAGGGGPAVIDGVAGFDQGGGVFRRDQLAFVLFAVSAHLVLLSRMDI